MPAKTLCFKNYLHFCLAKNNSNHFSLQKPISVYGNILTLSNRTRLLDCKSIDMSNRSMPLPCAFPQWEDSPHTAITLYMFSRKTVESSDFMHVHSFTHHIFSFNRCKDKYSECWVHVDILTNTLTQTHTESRLRLYLCVCDKWSICVQSVGCFLLSCLSLAKLSLVLLIMTAVKGVGDWMKSSGSAEKLWI